MDGGGLTVNEKGETNTVWQREGGIFYSIASQLEKQLDEMVYKLYELTVEEIKIVEGRK
jgi:hypothetical protein